MNVKTGTSVPKTQTIDKLIAELGPKHEQTAVTIVFADSSLCSFVVAGDLFKAQNHVAFWFAADEIKRVTFKAIASRPDVVTCPTCGIDGAAGNGCLFCEVTR